MATMTIETLLGGASVIERTIHSDMDLYQLGRSGLTKPALMELARHAGMTLKTLTGILRISERTVQRMAESDLLGESVSEHLIQIAQVYSLGYDVFDSAEDFQTWLNVPSVVFGSRKPVELLSSRFGMYMILDDLGRIEHGVYA